MFRPRTQEIFLKGGVDVSGKRPYLTPEAHVLWPPDEGALRIGSMTDGELQVYLQSAPIQEAGRLYRLKDGYCLRDFCGEELVIPVGSNAISDNQVAVLSPVGKFLWELLQSGRTFGDLLAAILGEYEVAPEQAAEDVKEFLSELDDHKYLCNEKENEQ